MSTSDIVLVIGVVTTSAVSVITALKVKAIEHSVNSAASAQVAKVDALTGQVTALTKNLTDAQETAKLLAQKTGPVKRTKVK